MSYALSPYLVDPAKVRGAVGSEDVKQRRMIGGALKSYIASLDRQFDIRIEDGAPSAYTALRAVIEGGPFEEEHAFMYGYAYKLVCEFHGKSLFNNPFSPFRGPWLEQVEEGMRSLGIKAVSPCDFNYGSVPSPLPTSDLPCYGEWSHAECQEGLAEWEASSAEQWQSLEGEVREAIETCVDWMRAACATEDRGVVGFMS